MDLPDDPGGRSGILPRFEPRAPEPDQADAPAPPRTPADPTSLAGEAPPDHEGEDPARYDEDSDPDDDAP